MAALDPNERKILPLPPGVTTGTGNYTAGTPIASRSAPTGPRVASKVDFSSTPGLERVGQGIGQFVGSHSTNPLLPAPPSTGRYVQSNVGRNRQPTVAPPLPSSQAGQPGVSIVPTAEARTLTTPQATVGNPTKATTPGFAASHFSANQPSGAPATDGLPAGVGETQNVYDLPGINRYTDASGVPTFTNKGRGGYDELQAQGATTGVPQISKESLDRTLATSPLFANRSADGVSHIDSGSAALARNAFAADQATAEAEANAANAERRILKRLPGLPAAQQPAALTAVTASQTARKGKPLSLDQVRAQQAPRLLAGGELTAGQNLLFGSKPPPATQRRIVSQPVPAGVDEHGLPNLPTGEKRYFSVDPATGQSMPVDLPGGVGQGGPQPTPGHIAALQQHRDNPQATQEFERIYGAGSAKQFLTPGR